MQIFTVKIKASTYELGLCTLIFLQFIIYLINIMQKQENNRVNITHIK